VVLEVPRTGIHAIPGAEGIGLAGGGGDDVALPGFHHGGRDGHVEALHGFDGDGAAEEADAHGGVDADHAVAVGFIVALSAEIVGGGAFEADEGEALAGIRHAEWDAIDGPGTADDVEVFAGGTGGADAAPVTTDGIVQGVVETHESIGHVVDVEL